MEPPKADVSLFIFFRSQPWSASSADSRSNVTPYCAKTVA